MSLDTVVNHNHHPAPPCPPCPPRPPQPAPKVLPTKNVILTHKFKKTVYALAVRTTTDAVFDSKYKYTLTEMLCDITDALTSSFQKIATLSEGFNALMKDCPEEFNTLKEIADYINVNGDPKSELINLIDTKVDKVEGMGLSHNDFDDIMKAKLVNDYSREQIDEIFHEYAIMTEDLRERVAALEMDNNVHISENGTEIKNGDIWIRLKGAYAPNPNI